MKTLTIAAPSLVAAALMLSACSGPAAKIFKDIDGNGKVSAGEKVLQSYKATLATSGGTLAQAEAKGIEGFGSGTSSNKAAADVTGTFVTGKIQTTADGLKVTVDGHEYFMPALDSVETTINGKKFAAGLYSAGTDTSPGYPVPQGDSAVKIQLNDASLTMFIKNYQAAFDSGSGYWNYSYDGYAIIAAGRETAADDLPTAIVAYQGGWFVISGLGATSASSQSTTGASGNFTAEVDFNKKTVDALAKDLSDNTVATATAKISGNKFIGTAKGSGFNGEIIGGFYGTKAQQMAGVGHGTSAGKNAELGFIGTQQ